MQAPTIGIGANPIIPAAHMTNLRKASIALGIALTYVSTLWPSIWVRDAAQAAAGPHPYEGVWIFIPHLLFYCTFSAVVAAACWFALAKPGAMDYRALRVSKDAAIWGLIGGVASVIASFVFLHAFDMGELGWRGFDGWKIAGNVFSNFYEEFIYRGFLLAAATLLIGFWPAAVLTSLAFGFSHDQYPLALQLFIACTSVFWCWIVRRSRSLWAAWGAHMIVDVVIDALWG
jgi:membrane protease YdiL (CAAX protease family)